MLDNGIVRTSFASDNPEAFSDNGNVPNDPGNDTGPVNAFDDAANAEAPETSETGSDEADKGEADDAPDTEAAKGIDNGSGADPDKAKPSSDADNVKAFDVDAANAKICCC